MNSGSQQATSLFSRSKTTKKLLASFRGNHQYIQEYHEMLWPGVSVDMIYSKFATFKKRPREEDQVQDAWLREHTISTSVFVSFMVMTMSCKYRNLVDRAAAGTAFQNLVTMMAATLGGFTLDIVPFGSNDNELTTLCIDQGGFVNASCFWTQAFYAQHARAVWGKDFRNEKKTWITLIHGLGKVHLAHLLSFALDPQHPEPLKGRLETETYNMLSEFANLLDSSVLSLAREIDKLEVVTQLKSKKKMRRAIKTIWIETLAKKLWNREEILIADVIRTLPKQIQGFLAPTIVGSMAMFVYFTSLVKKFKMVDTFHVYLDGSTVGKKATEILWLWSPDLQIGGWAPPQVLPKLVSEKLDGRDVFRLAILKLLQHTLVLMTGGKGLDYYIPQWARPTRDHARGDDMVNVELTPVSDESWGLLRVVCDEEGCQNKALHFLASYVGLRMAITPEVCHPKWNAFKRASEHGGMQFDLMRLTIAANFGHGARLTGERATYRKLMLERFLQRQSDAYFQDMAAEISLDRSLELDELGTSECRILIEDFLNAPSIRKRGDYVKNKSWFGVLNVLSLMVKDWAILREASNAIMTESGGADLLEVETDDEQDDGDNPDIIPDDEDAEEAGNIEKPKAMKKSEFFKAYQSKGTYCMYRDIMHDPTLRACAEILARVTKPLHMQYQKDLTAQQQGLEEIRRWQAKRCLGASFDTVAKILAVTLSPNLCKAMRISPRCCPPVPVETTQLEEDFMLINKAFRFGIHLAGNYGWSEMLHRLTLPLGASALLSTEFKDRKRCMSRLKKLVEAIITAENLVMAEEGPGELGTCLRDLAFHDESFAREIMIYLKRANYSLDSEHTAEAIQAMSKFTNGSSSTKEVLESSFGHLAHIVSKHSTNKSIAYSSVWMYLTASASLKSSGMAQHMPSESDWAHILGEYGLNGSESFQQFLKAFKASTTTIPTQPDIQLPKNMQGVEKSQWRLSGPASHYRSSAAAAYLMHDFPTFQHCDLAWAGVFFLRGQIFYDSSDDAFFLSLGFHGWCALGAELSKATIGGKDYLYLDHAAATHPVGSDLLFNFSFHRSCKWKFVEHTLIPPACMPDALPSVGCAVVVHNSNEWILKGSIKSGLFLNLQRLRQVCVALGIAKPAKGSGKNGALTKLDWSKALVSYLWPDCSQDFLSQVVGTLQGWTREKVDISILAMASNLDCDNQDAFKNLEKHAERALEEKIFGKGKASASNYDAEHVKKIGKAVQKEDAVKQKDAQRLSDLTPADLKTLLPGGGAISGVFWMRYHPVKKFWRADYPLKGDSLEADSCQRQWGTNRCPEAFDALHAVLSWVFRRWNSKNPHDKYDMPTDAALRAHIATLGIAAG